jgi:voltage-gated potassium channel Kch
MMRVMRPSSDPPPGSVVVLVVGDGELAAAVADAVGRAGGVARRLLRPSDGELATAVHAGPVRVVVVNHDDIVALRHALVAAHARPGVRLIVTIFDRTVASQIHRAVPNTHVVSLADATVPALAAACLGDGLLVVDGQDALTGDGAAPRRVRLPAPSRPRRALATALAQVRPFDGGSQLLVLGITGLIALLLLDVVLLIVSFGEAPLDAAYQAVKTATAVGPSPHAEDGPEWYEAFTTVAMLLSVVLLGISSAGLVNRLLSRRLTTIVGRRALPRRGHVIVVGLGQVGFRLCLEMRRLGVPPVGVEADADAPQVHLAKHAGIPVIIGDGVDRGLLEGLRLSRARAIAAVTSDDHVNIAVSVASLAVHRDARVVLRAGDDDAVTETRALFPIGEVRDVNRIGAETFASIALGSPDVVVFPDREGALHALTPDGRLERLGTV